jgi:hypothetical protein
VLLMDTRERRRAKLSKWEGGGDARQKNFKEFTRTLINPCSLPHTDQPIFSPTCPPRSYSSCVELS